MGKRNKSPKYKNKYKVKLIIHEEREVLASSEEDAMAYITDGVWKKTYYTPRGRERLQRIAEYTDHKKVLKKTAKIVSSELTDEEKARRRDSKYYRIQSSIPCVKCGSTRNKHYYLRWEEWWECNTDPFGSYEPTHSFHEWCLEKGITID